jgi:hypothetical protein
VKYLREEHRLRVFENRVVRRIFGPKREEDRSWRKLHNDELHNLYSSPSIVRMITSRRMRWEGHVAPMGEGEVFRRRWEINIELDLRETGIDGANWIRLAQDRVQWRASVNTAMNLRFP